jgi:hypothetical protein
MGDQVFSRRSLQLALIGALLVSLAFAAPAAAADRSIVMPSQTLRPDIGQYTVNFSARWSVYQGRDAGATWWFTSKHEISATIVNGAACVNAGTCKHTWLEAKVDFLRANGTIYKTLLLTSHNQCWPYYGGSWPTFTACTATTQQLPLGVTGLRWSARLHTMSDWRIDRVTPWSVKHVAIGG